MKCKECGAELPATETCQERFSGLLIAERDNARNMRYDFDLESLTLMTFYLQHAGGSGYKKRWQVEFAKNSFRQLFFEGHALSEIFPTTQREARQKASAAKGIPGAKDLITTSLGPLPGELTIATLDPISSPDFFEQVMAWVRSVADHRVFIPS